MKKFILLLCISFYLKAASQDSSLNKNNQLYFKPFSGWKKGNDKLTRKEFKTEIYKVPEATPLYNKAKQNEIIGLSMSAPVVTFALLSGPNNNVSSPNYGKTRIGFPIAAIISTATMSYFILRSKKQYKKAAHIYNEKHRLVY